MADRKYIYAVWRRKSSTAVVKLFPKWSWKTLIRVWEKTTDLKGYFWGHWYMIEDIYYPFEVVWPKTAKTYDLEIVVRWWGLMWQAEAIRLWIARWLVKVNEENRKILKPYWLLKRDPRIKERKKPGLKKARKSPQRSKR